MYLLSLAPDLLPKLKNRVCNSQPELWFKVRDSFKKSSLKLYFLKIWQVRLFGSVLPSKIITNDVGHFFEVTS